MSTIEGFGGKIALGVLRKSELCLNHSKLRMQFCLGAFNNVLYVFLLKFASFSKYYVCKKPVFVVTSARDRKTVISLKIQQTIDLSQRVSLKNIDFRLKTLKLDFTLTCDRKDDNFTQITAKCQLNAMCKLGNVDFRSFTDS